MTNDNKQPGYTLKKHIVKFLTFWIFPEILRKYAARRLRRLLRCVPVAVAGQYHPVTAAEVRHRGRYLPRHLAGRHRTHGGVEAAVGHSAALFAQGEKGRIIYTK